MSRKQFLLYISILGPFSWANRGRLLRPCLPSAVPPEALRHFQAFIVEWSRTCQENGIHSAWSRQALSQLKTVALRSNKSEYALVFRNSTNDFFHLIRRRNKRRVVIAKQLRKDLIELNGSWG